MIGINEGVLYCDFCGRSQHQAAVLVCGPTVAICDACSDAVAALVQERRKSTSISSSGTERPLEDEDRLII